MSKYPMKTNRTYKEVRTNLLLEICNKTDQVFVARQDGIFDDIIRRGISCVIPVRDGIKEKYDEQ